MISNIIDFHDTDGITIRDMKTTYLWSVVNPLAPGLVTAVHQLASGAVCCRRPARFA